jgi:hypothetical protein
VTTIIYVHGTGIRSAASGASVESIRAGVQRIRPDDRFSVCAWGDVVGSRLSAGGLSIPDTPELEQIDPWTLLLEDPLAELRLFGVPLPQDTALPPHLLEPAISALLRDPLTDEARLLANACALLDALQEARSIVGESEEFSASLASAGSQTWCWAVARAVVATAMSLAPDAAPTPVQRDALIGALVAPAAFEEKGPGDWIKEKLIAQLVKSANKRFRARRKELTTAFIAFPGDILLYQAHGSRLRAFIEQSIASAGDDVVLLAHSLGGVACFDLLAGKPMPTVKALITVGSQAPLLYELDALAGIAAGAVLPPHFPQPWINVFDRADFLSFVGGRLFPGRVTDIETDCRLLFPESHSAYWSQSALWDALREVLTA